MSATEQISRPTGVLIHAVITAVVMSVFAVGANATLQSFRGIFDGFGVELSPVTRFVLQSAWLWWLLAALAVALAAWVISRSHVTHAELGSMKKAMRVFSVVSGLAVAFAACALYLPAFERGAAI